MKKNIFSLEGLLPNAKLRFSNSPFKRFQVKVTLIIIFLISVVLLISNALIFKLTMDSNFDSLRERLKGIAQTAALMVDVDMLEQVPLNRTGIHSSAYKTLVARLNKIKQVNPSMKYLYVMTKTPQQGIWQFVVDADTIPEEMNYKNHHPQGKRQVLLAFPGDPYNASRFPQMLKAFEGSSADTKLERDEWGVTVSGYAPIYNQQGKAVAILGVDMAAEQVYSLQQEFRRRFVLVFILGFCLALLLGVVIVGPIIRPIEQLVEGTRRVAKGDLLYRLKVSTDDEIGELGRAFNQMATSLYKSRRRLLGYFYNVVKMLVRVSEARDQYTKGHSESVANYAGKIALRLGVSSDDVKFFKKVTVLHDIGKVGIRDSILNKPSELSEGEWEKIRQHTIIGEKILKPVLEDHNMLSAVRSHHERYDGCGYPDQLHGDNINIFASIVCVADSFHAMTSDRPYRTALSKDEAVSELTRHRGTQFHPKVVDAFLEILEEEKRF